MHRLVAILRYRAEPIHARDRFSDGGLIVIIRECLKRSRGKATSGSREVVLLQKWHK